MPQARGYRNAPQGGAARHSHPQAQLKAATAVADWPILGRAGDYGTGP